MIFSTFVANNSTEYNGGSTKFLIDNNIFSHSKFFGGLNNIILSRHEKANRACSNSPMIFDQAKLNEYY